MDDREYEIRQALYSLEMLLNAYPEQVFPEPDWHAVRSALAQAGITLDAVSGSNMRHAMSLVRQHVQKMRDALGPDSLAPLDSRRSKRQHTT